MLHICGICTYIYHKFRPDAGKYSSLMEHLGLQHLSSDQNPGYSVYIGDYMGLYYPVLIGIIIGHYKDPYQPTRIQWNVVPGFGSRCSLGISTTATEGETLQPFHVRLESEDANRQDGRQDSIFFHPRFKVAFLVKKPCDFPSPGHISKNLSDST